ncbi:tRNA (adenine(58)-N(1))-methyltransferase catalytic subunit TRMT61A [Gracilariopsis chorda]|uniref:tRNA (adenine(58)-N(1))-methyltransferase n=1 Tax=Gracilariopsis chorda TaxID=448386 RepID=A0A2V3IJ94_9FLOR|nr:tRNA (adenine(58)-N(1))-methyltransferase catalytic subunit TRMT61A [Gracilariopsis chorda]|eukprot:PXF42129.1 tRNA (adenine(58)-N(1))-methyltransferase catalytic subunit TRMT61A [Gracilariopsis chorda]
MRHYAPDDDGAAAVAKEGDLVIVHERYTALTTLTLQRDAFLNNRYGRFSHNHLIGKPLGRRWHAVSTAASGSRSCAGFVHALAPTPELMSYAMLHRTQIVYPHDSAIIAALLELRPGSVVVECGTGSGSASMAFARAVAPTGRVLTFEYHHVRAKAARQLFQSLQLSHVLSVSAGVDVLKDGFVGVQDASADAVFLDVPAPYEMGHQLRRVLRPNGTVCTFSPCVEQVGRTCAMLRKMRFHSLRTITAPLRTYETREQLLHTPAFDQLSSHLSTAAAASSSSTRSRPPSIGERVAKRRRTAVAAPVTNPTPAARKSTTAGAERMAVSALAHGQHVGRVLRPKVRLHSKPFCTMKGHTSYLTFARRPRDDAQREEQAPHSQGQVPSVPQHNCTLS